MARPRNSGRRESKALIVHPQHLHTLPKGPVVHTSFCGLPQDVLHLVASHCTTARDLCSLERVSTRCRQAACNEELWRRLTTSKFSVPEFANPPSWKQLYEYNHNFLRQVVLRQNLSETLMHLRMGGFGAFRVPVFA